jgi:restriction endonuclease S subunit
MSKTKNDIAKDLPKGWEWKSLNDVCIINPLKSETKPLGNLEVSFVPMADLKAKQMLFRPQQKKFLNEVYTGYTYFKNNDVLLAKVTPCFENGKSGIAKNLVNEIGFGSSEFYVLRPKQALPEYIYHIISNPAFLKAGEENMSGAVGLQRLTKDFLYNYKIPLPPLPEQQRIVQQLDALFLRIDKAIQLTKENLAHCQHLLPAALNEVFGEAEEKGWKVNKLSEVIVKIQTGTTPPSQEKKYYENGEVNWFTPSDFGRNMFVESASKKVTQLAI